MAIPPCTGNAKTHGNRIEQGDMKKIEMDTQMKKTDTDRQTDRQTDSNIDAQARMD